MIEDSENGVNLRIYKPDDMADFAEIEVSKWSDGTYKNRIEKEELKQVADMLYVAAEKMEE